MKDKTIVIVIPGEPGPITKYYGWDDISLTDLNLVITGLRSLAKWREDNEQ
jgi:hypothetical protein